MEDAFGFDPENERKYNHEKSDFDNFESSIIPFGSNSFEISVLSNKQIRDPDFVSKAHVEIQRITFYGTSTGGASECYPVEDGWYAPELSSHALQCEAGSQPSFDKASCVSCGLN